MNRILTAVLGLGMLAFTPALQAQDASCEDYTDQRPYEVAKLGVLGTAHFSAKRFKVIPELLAVSSYDDFATKSMRSLVENYSTNSADWNSAKDFVGNLTGDAGFALAAETAMLWAGFGMFVDILQSFNVGHREYAFIAPVAGRYHVQARLTGGIDKPRNRVIVKGSEGVIQLDDDNPSSDRTKDYWVNLNAGAHALSMQIGSGGSAVFHNAGTLQAVELDSLTPVQWDAPIILGLAKPLITQVMPNPGDRTTRTLPFSVPTRSSFPNLLDGTVGVDSIRLLPGPIQPHFYATWRADHLYWLCVTECTLAYSGDPQLNTGTGTATFFLQRGGDVMNTVVVKGPLLRPTE